jgi:hypothetical protein
MMGDMGDDFNAWRESKRQARQKYGVPCEDCIRLLPKASPSILMPGQKCSMHPFRAPQRSKSK